MTMRAPGSLTGPNGDHNTIIWEGTSGGAEGNMFDEVMGMVKAAGEIALLQAKRHWT